MLYRTLILTSSGVFFAAPQPFVLAGVALFVVHSIFHCNVRLHMEWTHYRQRVHSIVRGERSFTSLTSSVQPMASFIAAVLVTRHPDGSACSPPSKKRTEKSAVREPRI